MNLILKSFLLTSLFSVPLLASESFGGIGVSIYQVHGKLRAKANVAKDMDKAALEALAMANARVQEFTNGKTVVKVIAVPGKLVNIVVK